MKTIAIIDGDIISYRCAAANESRSVKVTHKTTGQTTEHAHRTAFKEHIKGVFEADEFIVEDVQTAEDIKFAYHAMKTTIESLCKSCDTDEYEIYLSGDSNFRDSLPLPTKYKSGRENTIRPLQLKECRNYLVKHHKALHAVNEEADDILARRCFEGVKYKVKTIACTIDGDQNGVEGYMYNWTKMQEPYRVKGLGYIELVKDGKDFDGYGRKFFYAQFLLGDSTDGFKPCQIAGKKFGVAGLYKVLGECKTDKQCMEAVYKQYKTWYPNEFTEYIDWTGKQQKVTLFELMDMYAACCHMKRFEGDVFNTKALLDKLGIKYGD
jgi:hypothetical protein